MAVSATLSAMLKMKCPQCHRGELFIHSGFSITNFDKMHEHCAVCKLRYERELGFYWGAMYMSYGLSVFIVLIAGVSLFYLANDPPTWVYITVVTAAILLFTPFLFRYGRVIMLYAFGGVSYNPAFEK